jgi:hypothetical protein
LAAPQFLQRNKYNRKGSHFGTLLEIQVGKLFQREDGDVLREGIRRLKS